MEKTSPKVPRNENDNKFLYIKINLYINRKKKPSEY